MNRLLLGAFRVHRTDLSSVPNRCVCGSPRSPSQVGGFAGPEQPELGRVIGTDRYRSREPERALAGDDSRQCGAVRIREPDWCEPSREDRIDSGRTFNVDKGKQTSTDRLCRPPSKGYTMRCPGVLFDSAAQRPRLDQPRRPTAEVRQYKPRTRRRHRRHVANRLDCPTMGRRQRGLIWDAWGMMQISRN